jgi:hypothetical protein
MTSNADFAEWRKRNPAPNLQALVAKHGGYSNILPRAWAELNGCEFANSKPGRSDLKVTVVLLLPTGYVYRIVPSRAFGRQTEVNEKQSEQTMGR